MVGPQRITMREALDEPSLVQHLAQVLGLDNVAVMALFAAAAGRLRDMLNLRASPFDVRINGTVRVDGIAGLLRLTPTVELQIVPKFLDPADPGWQEDFFLLAVFSQTGRILPREEIRAGRADRGDLATLVGRTLALMYWENQRRPIRTYRGRTVAEFSYDGDADPMDLLVPEEDGFRQNVLQFQRNNHYNAVIAAAVKNLIPEVRDAETRKQLLRIQRDLVSQEPVRSLRHRSLPARHRHWQQAYDLATVVVRGFGVGYVDEHMLAPGFLLRTWTTWQSLVEAALRSGLPALSVMGQQPYRLGRRTAGRLDVTPDAVVLKGGQPVLVVDAKYRTKVAVSPTVNAGDVYETLAFMRATGTKRAVLLYPRPSTFGPRQPVGETTQFEHIEAGAERITAMLVECRGVSDADGYGQLCSRLGTAITQSIS